MTRTRRGWRTLLGALLVLLLLVGAALAAAALLIDPARFKPEIAAAVQRATGHALRLDGPVRLRLFPPRVTVADATLAGVARVGSLEARIAPLALLHGTLEVARLDLHHPEITLPLPPPEPSAPAAAPAAATAAPAGRLQLDIAAVHISDGVLIWHGATRTLSLGVPTLDATASGPSLLFSGTLRSAGRLLTLTGETGNLARLLDRSATTPWPVQLVVQDTAARLAIRGTFARPLQGRGYILQVDAAATDLAAFTPLLAGTPPTLHDASVSARLADQGGAWPAIDGLTVHVGGLAMPELTIERADIVAPGGGETVQADLDGTLHGAKLRVTATLAGTLRPGGSAALRATVTAPIAELTTELTVGLTAHPLLRGTLAAQRLDIDMLRAALRPAAVAAPPPGQPPPPPRRLIPDRAFDLSALHLADADLLLSATTLIAGGASYDNARGHLLLQNGRLVLDPAAADSPGGPVEGRFAIDARTATSPMALRLRAPTLALGPLAAALGHPGAITGDGFVDADLQGAGASPAELAGSLTGHLGIAVGEATADNAALSALLGGVLHAARLPPEVLGETGQTRLRCLALRLRADDGIADVTTLVADTGRLLLEGSGSVALAPETLDLHLRPLLRVGPGIIVPVRLGGTLLTPKATVEAGRGAATALLGALLGAKMKAEPPADPCPAALAAARGEVPQ